MKKFTNFLVGLFTKHIPIKILAIALEVFAVLVLNL